MRTLLPTLLLFLWASPIGAQPAAEYRTVHPEAPAWLVARFDKALSTVYDPGFDGPRPDRELVRAFLYETYEHLREVSTLTRELGGRARDLPESADPNDPLRGIHDFGERASVARVEALIKRLEASPLLDGEGKPLPVPEWLRRLPERARARGETTVDIGKLSPYVAAGLGRPGRSYDPFSMELHRLSPHHNKLPRGALLSENLADKINAMRQVRVYKSDPLPFSKIREILRSELGKALPSEAGEAIDRALETQARLERSGRVNPYHLLEGRPATRPERLARYRRPDGTLDWKQLGRERALKGAGGLAHFGLALFLKELAVVARSGDRARMEEFFDGLLTTDFYVDYGLFVLGARAGEVAYGRYLQRFIRPRFVSGILKTNLVLAAGLALPQLVRGQLSGKAFAISFSALGLSTAAVRSGVAGLRWVVELKTARRASAATVAAGRLARAGGWFYTAAELAVILYFGEAIEERLTAWSDLREARAALAAASERFAARLGHTRLSAGDVAAATEELETAWTDYRDFLYRPLMLDEARFAGRMEKTARDAKIADDERRAALERVRAHPSLLAKTVAQHGSLDEFAESLTREDERKVADAVASAVASYDASRAEHLEEVYEGSRRGSPFLGDVEDLSWAVLGGVAGATGDPYGARPDFVARVGRGRARVALSRALHHVSANRLETYTDQAALLRAASGALEARGESDLAAPLEEALTRVERTRALDERLFRGDGATLDLDAGGAVRGLERGR